MSKTSKTKKSIKKTIKKSKKKPMEIEFEAKFLDINKDNLIQKLKSLGAKMTQPNTLYKNLWSYGIPSTM